MSKLVRLTAHWSGETETFDLFINPEHIIRLRPHEDVGHTYMLTTGDPEDVEICLVGTPAEVAALCAGEKTTPTDFQQWEKYRELACQWECLPGNNSNLVEMYHGLAAKALERHQAANPSSAGEQAE